MYKDILDVVAVPRLDPDAHETISSLCFREGVRDNEVLAIGAYNEEGRLDPVYRAWRINLLNGSLDELPLDGLECRIEYFYP